MAKWPIGVFTSVDAGLGVKLEVAKELGVPTIQLHAPHQHTRTQQNADAFLERLKEFDITLTCVFGGFEGDRPNSGGAPRSRFAVNLRSPPEGIGLSRHREFARLPPLPGRPWLC